jgi:F-type H+-transporting ATPase subunit b
MADGQKKSFLKSGAFILVLVWLALGVALSAGVYASRPAMLKVCEGYLEQYHQKVTAPGPEAEPREGVNPCFEYEELILGLKTAAKGETSEEGAAISPEQAQQALAELPGPNLAAAMYSWTDKMKLGNAWAIPNFLILITMLVYFTKDMLVGSMNSRREELAKVLRETENARKEAVALKADYESKLKDLGNELERLKAEMRAQGEDEKARILKAAEVQAQRIRTEADFTAKQEILVAQYRLKEEAARLAVQVAEQVIREVITDKDRDRLLTDYLETVKEQAK